MVCNFLIRTSGNRTDLDRIAACEGKFMLHHVEIPATPLRTISSVSEVYSEFYRRKEHPSIDQVGFTCAGHHLGCRSQILDRARSRRELELSPLSAGDMFEDLQWLPET